MTLTIKQLLLLTAILTYSLTGNAQSTAQKYTNEYYLQITGVSTKADVKVLNGILNAGLQNTYVLGFGLNNRGYIIKSNNAIPKSTIDRLLTNSKYKVSTYESGSFKNEDVVHKKINSLSVSQKASKSENQTATFEKQNLNFIKKSL